MVLEDSQGAWLGRVKYTRSTFTATSSLDPVADWSCTIQIPQEHAEKLHSGWKKIWYQQLRTQVSQSEVETEAIEAAAASTANNHAQAKRPSRFLTRSIPSYTEGEEQGIEQWVARFRYECPWKVDFEKLEFTHSDRQHFKNLRSTEDLMEEMSASRHESQATEGQTLSNLVGERLTGQRTSTGHKRMHSEVSSRPSMEIEMSVHEDYWPYDSQEKLDEAIVDAKSYWISQGSNPQAYTDKQWGSFLKKKIKESKQRARE